MDTPRDTQNSGAKTKVIAVLVVVLLVAAYFIIRMIQDAPTAGEGAHGPPPGGGGGPPQMPPASVLVVPVEMENTQDRAMVTGVLQAISKADVAAQEAGAVEALFVREGDSVEEGDPLVLLDIRRNTAQLNVSKASLISAENLLAQRKAEVARAEKDVQMKMELHLTKAVSESDLLDAQKTLIVAKAQKDAAQASIEEALNQMELSTVQLGDLTVKAPFDGTVVARHVDPGEWVGAGTTVATVIATDPVEAWLRVPSRFLGRVSTTADSYQIRQASTGNIVEPKELSVVPDVDARSQLFTVIATISNKEGKLIPGESITGIVPVGEKVPFLKVPTNAIVHSPMGMMVQIVQPSEDPKGLPMARGVPVKVEFQRRGFAYVQAAIAGFQAGDQVIVEGNQNLMPRQPIMIKPAGEADPVSPQNDQPGKPEGQ